MVLPRHLPRVLLVAWAAAASLFTGCNMAAPAYTGPGFTAKVRVESVARGVGLKVNGELVATELPANITLEVGEDGLTIRSYSIYLNRNILPNVPDDRPSARVGDIANALSVTIDAGQPLPARIRFDGNSPVLLGTAIVNGPR